MTIFVTSEYDERESEDGLVTLIKSKDFSVILLDICLAFMMKTSYCRDQEANERFRRLLNCAGCYVG